MIEDLKRVFTSNYLDGEFLGFLAMSAVFCSLLRITVPSRHHLLIFKGVSLTSSPNISIKDKNAVKIILKLCKHRYLSSEAINIKN